MESSGYVCPAGSPKVLPACSACILYRIKSAASSGELMLSFSSGFFFKQSVPQFNRRLYLCCLSWPETVNCAYLLEICPLQARLIHQIAPVNASLIEQHFPLPRLPCSRIASNSAVLSALGPFFSSLSRGRSSISRSVMR